jgi:hypothetical protein
MGEVTLKDLLAIFAIQIILFVALMNHLIGRNDELLEYTELLFTLKSAQIR